MSWRIILHEIKFLWHWIMAMLYSLFLDFLILIVGIFSKQTRYLYVKHMYPDLLKNKTESEGE